MAGRGEAVAEGVPPGHEAAAPIPDPPPPAPPARTTGSRVGRGILRTLKGVALLVFLLLALGIGWFTVAPPNLNPYAPQLAAMLSRHAGLEVVLSGISLRLGWDLAVVGQGLAAYPPETTVVTRIALARAKEVRIRLSPSAWVTTGSPWSVELEEARLTVRRNPAGEWLVGGITLEGAGSTGAAPSPWNRQGGGGGIPLPFASLTLTNSTLAFLDEARTDSRGRPLEAMLTQLALSAQRDSSGAFRFQGEGELDTGVHRAGLSASGEWRADGGGQLSVRTFQLRLQPLKPYLAHIHPLDGLDLPLSLTLFARWSADGRPRVEWQLEAGEGSLDWHQLFRWPFPVTRAEAKGRVEMEEEGWKVTVERFTLANPHGRAEGDFELSRLGSGDPWLDLRASAAGVSTQQARFYYPARIMHPELVEWLDRSLQEGRAVRATVRIQGPAKGIPFAPPPPPGAEPASGNAAGDQPAGSGEHTPTPEGIFLIGGEVEGVNLEYWPGLPPITDMHVEVVFDRLSMTAQVRDGRMGESRRVRGRVHIPDMLHDPVVEIEARAEAELGEAWRSVMAAPVLHWDRAIGLEGAEFAGRGELELQLELPIQHLAASRYQGQLRFEGVTARLPFLKEPLQELGGELELDREHLRLRVPGGRFDGMPLRDGLLEVAPVADPANSTLKLTLAGTVGEGMVPDALRSLLKRDGRVAGRAGWQLGVERHPGGKGFGIRLSSTLDDLGIQGGAGGWEKARGEAGELELEGELDHTGQLALQRLNLQVGRLTLAGKGKWSLHQERGSLRLDGFRLGETRGSLAVDRTRSGWELRARLKQLDLSSWLDEEKGKGGEGEAPPEEEVRPEDPDAEWPTTTFQLEADRVLLANGHRGHNLEARGVSRGRGLKLEHARFLHQQGSKEPGEQRETRGSAGWAWSERLHSGPYTGELYLKSGDLGWLLNALGVHEGWEGGEVSMALSLEGHAKPGPPLLHQLSGEGWLEAQRGVIRSMNFLSKLLGLLSLPDLPDLLVGERPDLKGKGFYYDTFRGVFNVRKGVWGADGLELTGPSMKIVASGKLDLPARQVDALVGIRPMQTVDNLVGRVPLVGKLVEGSRDALVETLLHVTGTPGKPEVALKTVQSLAPGVLKDILELPGKWWSRIRGLTPTAEKAEPEPAANGNGTAAPSTPRK